MKKNFAAGMLFAASCTIATAAMAADPELCLDCHEPAEDWAGMSVDELVKNAMDLSNKRHEDNAGISVEEMKAIIAELMPTAE